MPISFGKEFKNIPIIVANTAMVGFSTACQVGAITTERATIRIWGRASTTLNGGVRLIIIDK